MFVGGAPGREAGWARLLRSSARDWAAMTLLAQNLAKSFGHTRAVDDVSITLIPGAVHALVGENGAGKSTMLRMLAGAEKPDRGEMHLDGSLYAPPSSSDAAKRGVALVFQEVTINRSLTVAENIFIDRLRRVYGTTETDQSPAHERDGAGDFGSSRCPHICRVRSGAP